MKNPMRLIFEIKCKDRKDCWCFALFFPFLTLFRSEKCNFAHKSGQKCVSGWIIILVSWCLGKFKI